MQTLIIGQGQFVTGDEIAKVVLDSSVTLAFLRRVEVIDLPHVIDGGFRLDTAIAIGWGTEIGMVPSRSPWVELEDVRFTDRTRAQVNRRHCAQDELVLEGDTFATNWDALNI